MQLQGTLVGRVIRDPEMSYTPNGMAVTKFTLPSNLYDKNKGRDEQETQWVNVTAFGKQAETINEMCHKGTIVMVSGRLECRQYQARDKTMKLSIDLAVSTIEYITDFGKPKADTKGTIAGTDALGDLEDIPF